jgi:hypothetical protein
MKLKNKKGTLLVENVVFIILNLMFLAILILFLAKQGSGAILLEQSYAKNIALLIDSSKPVMELMLDMEKGMQVAEKKGVNFDDVVDITGNVVRVKLSEKGGYEYSFFNHVDATAYPDTTAPGYYIIKINGYKENVEE